MQTLQSCQLLPECRPPFPGAKGVGMRWGGQEVTYSGMSTMVVTPPAAAARVAVQKPSQDVRPGSFTCTWLSTRPGITTRSSTSHTCPNKHKHRKCDFITVTSQVRCRSDEVMRMTSCSQCDISTRTAVSKVLIDKVTDNGYKRVNRVIVRLVTRLYPLVV